MDYRKKYAQDEYSFLILKFEKTDGGDSFVVVLKKKSGRG